MRRGLFNGRTYESRARVLRRMGFRSYAEYLKSDLWREVKARMFKVKGTNCYLCNRPAYTGHHNRYHEDDLNGNRLKFLHPICQKCHSEIERHSDGTKTEFYEARQRYNRARRMRSALGHQQDGECFANKGEITAMFAYLNHDAE